MNNENDYTSSQRHSADTTPSPVFRRSKSVRASFRMLSSRWKASNNGNSATDKNEPAIVTTKPQQKMQGIKQNMSNDIVSERFGKDFRRNIKQPMVESNEPALSLAAPVSEQMPQPLAPTKQRMRFFNAFAKENACERYSQYEVPKNVAPKAAALLQIPLLPSQPPQIFQHRHHQYSHQQQSNRAVAPVTKNSTNNDLLHNGTTFDVQLDRNACNMIVNSIQFALLKTLQEPEVESMAKNNYRDVFKPATIRRTPYWASKQPSKFCRTLEKQSKNTIISDIELRRVKQPILHSI